jgi:hypothetical protein
MRILLQFPEGLKQSALDNNLLLIMQSATNRKVTKFIFQHHHATGPVTLHSMKQKQSMQKKSSTLATHLSLKGNCRLKLNIWKTVLMLTWINSGVQ